jgi:putative PIN family toxin of toxin-antitoxin system
MNILVDTNVLLSAALRDRLPEQVVLHVATSDEHRWIVTVEILQEYLEVLKRPKFELPDHVLRNWSELIALRTVEVPSSPQVVNLPRDPKDAKFLAAAITSDADLLLTGDRDLLEAKLTLRTRVISVAESASELKIV